MQSFSAARFTRQRPIWPFLATGAIGVVGGGLASAAFAGNPSYRSSWAVAYLVLVVGVAQFAFGAGIERLAGAGLTSRTAWLIFAAFNLGNAGVLLGTLLKDRASGSAYLVDLGSLLLAASLALGLRVVWSAPPSRLRAVFVALVVFLLGSSLVGIFLTHR